MKVLFENKRVRIKTKNSKFPIVKIGKESDYIQILVNSNDESLGSVTGSGIYKKGSIISIRAIAKDDGIFVKWNDNNADQERNIIVNKKTIYIAIFRNKNSGTLYYMKNEGYINQDFRQ